jgi:hypothetical protein
MNSATENQIQNKEQPKVSFPPGELTEEEFFAQRDALEAAALQFGVGAHAAHVNLKEGKAFSFLSGPYEEFIRKAHEAVHLPYDSITEVRRVTGADMRLQPLETGRAAQVNRRCPAIRRLGATTVRARPVYAGLQTDRRPAPKSHCAALLSVE